MRDVIYDLAAWTSVASNDLPGDLLAATRVLERHSRTDLVTLVCVVTSVLAAEHGDRWRLPSQVVEVLGEPAGFAEGYRELLEYLSDPLDVDMAETTPSIADGQAGTWLLDLMFALSLLTCPPGGVASDQVFAAARFGQQQGLLPSSAS